ncbi:MAG: TIR domain-containing protein [Phycisphaerae bacterium]|nr:TIR domain-containing protein [Phycisphaerae bacterium]
MNASAATKLYICHEPDHDLIAAKLDAWPRTNSDIARYNQRHSINPESELAEPLKTELRAQIHAADVVVCVVGQATFLDPWIKWELTTARSKTHRGGFVAVMLDDLYAHPPSLIGAGTMFIKLKRTFVMDAIAWAADQQDPCEDFILED